MRNDLPRREPGLPSRATPWRAAPRWSRAEPSAARDPGGAEPPALGPLRRACPRCGSGMPALHRQAPQGRRSARPGRRGAGGPTSLLGGLQRNDARRKGERRRGGDRRRPLPQPTRSAPRDAIATRSRPAPRRTHPRVPRAAEPKAVRLRSPVWLGARACPGQAQCRAARMPSCERGGGRAGCCGTGRPFERASEGDFLAAWLAIG